MRKQATVVLGVTGAVLLTSAGCDQDVGPNDAFGDMEVVSDALYGNKNLCPGGASGFWTSSPTGPTPTIIPVCWENATSSNATIRGWIQSSISESWQRWGRVNFTGWGSCTSGASGIHVQFTTATGGGFASITPPGKCTQNGVQNGMLINPNLSPQRAAQSIAMHEFGHALGFYHEEQRPEAGSACSPACASNQQCVNGTCVSCPGTHNWGATTNGQQKYGQYDFDSLMSYCGQGSGFVDNCSTCSGNWKLKPSGNDLTSLHVSHGRRIAGQLVSSDGRCLALATFNPGNPGAKPFLWTCDEVQDDQEWARSTPARSFSIDTSGTGNGVRGCLYGGTDIEVRDCDGTFSQTWDLTDVELRGWGGKCLDLRGGDTTNGTPVQIYDCFSDRFPALYNGNQKWNIVRVSSTSALFEIRLTSNTSKCVTVSGGVVNGSPLVISSCTGSVTQRFYTNATGSILHAGSGIAGKCLDAAGVNSAEYLNGQGMPWDTAPIALFTCGSATMNQKWNVTGPIRKALGGCLTRPSDGGIWPSTTTCVQPTSSRGTQIWDYYL